MAQEVITVETTVFDVLDQVPGAFDLFWQHGVNPAAECGPLTRQILLKETPDRCHLVDLDGLIAELNEIIQAN